MYAGISKEPIGDRPSDALRIWSKEGKLLYTGKPHGHSVLWGADWIRDSKKIVTVSFDSGNIQL